MDKNGGEWRRIYFHIHRQGAASKHHVVEFGDGTARLVVRPPWSAPHRTRDVAPTKAQLVRFASQMKQLAGAIAGDHSVEELRELYRWVSTRPGAQDDPVSKRGKPPIVKAQVYRFFYGLPVEERLSVTAYKLRGRYTKAGNTGTKSTVESLIGELKDLEQLAEQTKKK